MTILHLFSLFNVIANQIGTCTLSIDSKGPNSPYKSLQSAAPTQIRRILLMFMLQMISIKSSSAYDSLDSNAIYKEFQVL